METFCLNSAYFIKRMNILILSRNNNKRAQRALERSPETEGF